MEKMPILNLLDNIVLETLVEDIQYLPAPSVHKIKLTQQKYGVYNCIESALKDGEHIGVAEQLAGKKFKISIKTVRKYYKEIQSYKNLI